MAIAGDVAAASSRAERWRLPLLYRPSAAVARWLLARIGERLGRSHSIILRALERAGVVRRDSRWTQEKYLTVCI
jgi:hypothetical protein